MICIEICWKSIFLANIRRDRFDSEHAPATLNRPFGPNVNLCACVRFNQSTYLFYQLLSSRLLTLVWCRLAAWTMTINPFADDVRYLSDGALSFNHRIGWNWLLAGHLMRCTVLIIAGTIVHFHVDHFFFVVVALVAARMVVAVALGVVLLLHSLVLGATVLEPNFNLQRAHVGKQRRQRKMRKNVKRKQTFNNLHDMHEINETTQQHIN